MPSSVQNVVECSLGSLLSRLFLLGLFTNIDLLGQLFNFILNAFKVWLLQVLKQFGIGDLENVNCVPEILDMVEHRKGSEFVGLEVCLP